MATTLISRKRGLAEAFGGNGANTMCSPSPKKITFLGLEEESARRTKRTLMMMEMMENGRRSEAHKVARGLKNRCVQPLADRAEAEESPEPSAFEGASPSPARVDLDAPSEKDKKRLCKMCKSRAGERLYTENEVREIVQKEVGKREKEMEETYNEILQERLTEQYNNFSRFHEDCVSRQLNQSDYSYMN